MTAVIEGPEARPSPKPPPTALNPQILPVSDLTATPGRFSFQRDRFWFVCRCLTGRRELVTQRAWLRKTRWFCYGSLVRSVANTVEKPLRLKEGHECAGM